MELLNKKKTDSVPEYEGEQKIALAVPSVGQMAAEEETEIDLIDLGLTLLDKIHFIILWLLAGAVVFNAYAFFCIPPTYQSTAKMYIVSASNDSVVDLTDLNIGTSLTSDYEQLMLSYPVLDQVIEELNLEIDSASLARQISLQNPEDTRILNVTATTTSPELSRDIANKLVEVSVQYLPETMSTNPPNIAQKARLAETKTDPSYSKYTLMGALLGAVLYSGFVVMRRLMDDTLHTAEDVEKYFGEIPLTIIPASELFEEVEKQEERKWGSSYNKKKFGRGKRT